MGKTAFAIGAALAIGRTHNVAYFTLEMGSQLILERLLVNESMVNYKALKSGMVKRNSEMWNRLVQASDNLKSYNILIDDSSVLSPFALERKLDIIAPVVGIDCVIIDYLQLMTDKRGESREVEVSDISRKLKGFAMNYKIPFIVLCQLNRRITEDESNRPKMHHLRESGSIEQNADKIFFIHRSDYERTSFDDSEKVGEAEIIVAKQRNGPIGSVEVCWMGECMKFVEKL